jgi:hypothetical protein
MAYGDNILDADHKWSFNNTLVDSVGSLDATASATGFATVQVSRDTTRSLVTDGRDDSAQTALGVTQDGTRKIISGWFRTNQIQGPPVCVYKEGGTSGIHIYLWAGNNVLVEVKDSAGTLNTQLYSNFALTNNRNYHFTVKYETSSFDNSVKFYIDGIEQTRAIPNKVLGQASFSTYTGVATWGENTDIQPGGASVIIKAPVNGYYSNWWSFSGNGAQKTDEQIRELLFAPGAIPQDIITSGTQANMQSQLDALANSTRGDFPLNILVQAVTGDGDLNLSADNIKFPSRSSLHVRYEGTGTLRWTNNNGSDAKLGSGNVVFQNPFTLTLTNIQPNTEIRVYEAGTTNEIAGEESNITGSFSTTVSVSSVDIRIASLSYRITSLLGVNITSNVSIALSQFEDRNYFNP